MAKENTKSFGKLADKIVKNIETNVKGVSLEIHANLVEDTPRDTGWAANNWIAQLYRAFKGTVGSPENVQTSGSATSLARISRWESGRGPIYISNNVPYIGRLNAGSSKKAPAGFVEKAVQRALNSFGRRRPR